MFTLPISESDILGVASIHRPGLNEIADGKIIWISHVYRILRNVPDNFITQNIESCYFYDKYILFFDIKENHKVWFFFRNGIYSHYISILTLDTIAEYKWRSDIPAIWYALNSTCHWYMINIEGKIIEDGNYNTIEGVLQQVHPVLQQSGDFYFTSPDAVVQISEPGNEQIVLQGIDSSTMHGIILTPAWITIPGDVTYCRIVSTFTGDIYTMPLKAGGSKYHFGDLYPKFAEKDNWFNLVSQEEYEKLLLKHGNLNRDHLPAALKRGEVLLIQRKLKRGVKINP